MLIVPLFKHICYANTNLTQTFCRHLLKVTLIWHVLSKMIWPFLCLKRFWRFKITDKIIILQLHQIRKEKRGEVTKSHGLLWRTTQWAVIIIPNKLYGHHKKGKISMPCIHTWPNHARVRNANQPHHVSSTFMKLGL